MTPPTLSVDLSYALDCYPMEFKVELHNLRLRSFLVCNNVQEFLSEKEFSTNFENSGIFHIYTGFRKGFSCPPLKIKNKNWIQAKTTLKVHQYWFRITRYSGKFIVYTDPSSHNCFWRVFSKAHIEGALGYGLRSTTAKCDFTMFMIHIGNVFDLDDVARVASKINDLLDNNFYTFSLFTDFSTEMRVLDPDHTLTKPLFTFHPEDFNESFDETFKSKRADEAAWTRWTLDEYLKT